MSRFKVPSDTQCKLADVVLGQRTRADTCFCCLAADAVCRWATHAHLLLTPLDKADESLRDSGNSTFHNNMYTGFDANKVHPTHRATAISAVSAVAIVNSHQLSNQQHVNALLSWRYPLQLVPKLKHSQQPELSPQAELSLQPQLSPQPEQSPQPELSQQHGRSPQLEHSPQLELDAMTQHVQRSLSSQQPGVTEFQSAAQLAGLEMPQASNTDLLQINFREVLGHGNTGVVFAGE